jgi:mono/diheme cytochrome c family protein
VGAGAVNFQHYCQVCHGADGHGTGVLFTETMSPPIPDLDDDDIQEYTDGQLKWIIQNGIRFTGMPGWNGIVKDEQMWYMVSYIRHLPKRENASVTRVSRHHR